MCLAHGQNALTSVRLEPATPRSPLSHCASIRTLFDSTYVMSSHAEDVSGIESSLISCNEDKDFLLLTGTLAQLQDNNIGPLATYHV